MAFESAAAEVDGRPVGGTVSIGMVIAETNLFDIPALLAQADEALYCAKERGRNRVEVASLQLVLERAKEADAARPAACPRSARAQRGLGRALRNSVLSARLAECALCAKSD